MAKKTLNEAVVRRFQRLANVAPINEMYHKRDEEMEEGMYAKRDEEEVMKEEEEAEEVPAPEMPEEEPMEMGDEDKDLELTDEEAQAIIDLGQKLEAAMAEETDMGDEPEAIDDAGEEAEEGDELMEALADIDYVPSRDEVVNEVAKRVARRLKEAKLHESKLNRALGSRRR
jgi:hypothetical protein